MVHDMSLTDPRELRLRLTDPLTRRQAALEMGDWIRALCLLMGTSFKTACIVGAEFAAGLEQEWSNFNERSRQNPY